MVYTDFESILAPEDTNKDTNKYQKYVACSYGYKLVCVDNKFSMPSRLYQGEHAAYNFISSIIK